MLYNIYAGLESGFGWAEYVGTVDTIADEAKTIAYEMAKEEYTFYEGSHGIRSIDQIMEEEEVDEDEATNIYLDEVESWIYYYIVPTSEDSIDKEELIYL